MIICDGIHLTSTLSLRELHEFASKNGLKREWFQDKKIPHYDLTTPRAFRRIRLAATELKNFTFFFTVVSTRVLVKEAIRKNDPVIGELPDECKAFLRLERSER